MTYGWRTQKTEAGYIWEVYSFEYGVGTINRKAGLCPSRAMATLRAKRWVKHFRATLKQAA